jgi:hypothetical protein
VYAPLPPWEDGEGDDAAYHRALAVRVHVPRHGVPAARPAPAAA